MNAYPSYLHLKQFVKATSLYREIWRALEHNIQPMKDALSAVRVCAEKLWIVDETKSPSHDDDGKHHHHHHGIGQRSLSSSQTIKLGRSWPDRDGEHRLCLHTQSKQQERSQRRARRVHERMDENTFAIYRGIQRKKQQMNTLNSGFITGYQCPCIRSGSCPSPCRLQWQQWR